MVNTLKVQFENRFSKTVSVCAEFQVEAQSSQMIGVYGYSGSGKSTLLRAIAGLIRPAQGLIQFGNEIWFDSTQMIWVAPQQREIGYISQEPSLFPHLSVQGNIQFGLYRLSRSSQSDRIKKILSLLQLDLWKDRYPSELSGGQKQKVALARTLVTQPKLLLLDEPFSALDSSSRRAMRKLLNTAVQEMGIPTLLVSHDWTELLSLSSQWVSLRQGRFTQVSELETQAEYQEERRAEYQAEVWAEVWSKSRNSDAGFI